MMPTMKRLKKTKQKDKQIESFVRKQEKFEQLIQSHIDSGQSKPLKNQ